MSASETQDGDGGCVLWDDLDEEYRRTNLRSWKRRAIRPPAGRQRPGLGMRGLSAPAPLF
jgi:hypothetical protein